MWGTHREANRQGPCSHRAHTLCPQPCLSSSKPGIGQEPSSHRGFHWQTRHSGLTYSMGLWQHMVPSSQPACLQWRKQPQALLGKLSIQGTAQSQANSKAAISRQSGVEKNGLLWGQKTQFLHLVARQGLTINSFAHFWKMVIITIVNVYNIMCLMLLDALDRYYLTLITTLCRGTAMLRQSGS